jgi:hypothetical protein
MPGRKRISASFRGIKKTFRYAKDAYIWLIDNFVSVKPDLLDEDWQKEFAAKGRVRNYFSRDRKDLFEASPHLAEDSNNYARIAKRDWYAITNLNNAEKFQILCNLAAVAGLRYELDWTWDDGTKKAPLSEVF